MVYICLPRSVQQIEMIFKKMPMQPVHSTAIEHSIPTVAVVCPACGSEANLSEIIEDRGSVRCVNCR